MKKHILFFLTFIIQTISFAQIDDAQNGSYGYYEDAYMMNRQLYGGGGTARYSSIGGCGVALGGDIGAAYTNPAGLGVFRKSEISFTPDFGFIGTNSSYSRNAKNIEFEGNQKSNSGSFAFSNIGIVLNEGKIDGTTDDWKGGSFALSVNRTNNFNSKVSYQGVGAPGSSMSKYFANLAQSNNIEDLDSQVPVSLGGDGIYSLDALAYWTYLINPYFDQNNNFYTLNEDETMLQEEFITTKGGQTQWNFAYGNNYKDQLFIGGSLGITGIRYIKESTYKETVGYEQSGEFIAAPDSVNYFEFYNYLKIKGTGINGKIGIMYQVNDDVRLGLSIQSPTYYYSMNSSYNSSLQVIYDGSVQLYGSNGSVSYLKNEYESTVPGEFKYRVTSPLRVRPGITYFMDKNGFITAETEFIPYQLTTFTATDANYNQFLVADNNSIAQLYKSTFNTRIGAEYRADILRLRAGFAHIGNPYINKNLKRNIYQLTGGIGIKTNDFYIDIALLNSIFNSYSSPYRLNKTEPAIKTRNNVTNFMITAGFYFE